MGSSPTVGTRIKSQSFALTFLEKHKSGTRKGNEQSSIEYAQNVGYKSGYDNGYKNGEENGMKEGKAEGKIEGKNERNIEIAKNMLKKQMTVKDIADVTGLSPEEIEALK